MNYLIREIDCSSTKDFIVITRSDNIDCPKYERSTRFRYLSPLPGNSLVLTKSDHICASKISDLRIIN